MPLNHTLHIPLLCALTLDHCSDMKTQCFIFPSCEAPLFFPSASSFLLFFPSCCFAVLPSQEHVSPFLLTPIPPSSTSSASVASLLHIQLPLCSYPHPSLLLSSPLFPAPRYRQTLLSPCSTLLVLSRKQVRKTLSTVRAAVRMLLCNVVIQSALSFC